MKVFGFNGFILTQRRKDAEKILTLIWFWLDCAAAPMSDSGQFARFLKGGAMVSVAATGSPSSIH
jgi:hypothetical protein